MRLRRVEGVDADAFWVGWWWNLGSAARAVMVGFGSGFAFVNGMYCT